MWNINNETPYAASYAVSQDFKTGGSIWQVAVKGTYDISEIGELRIADEQPEVLTDPEYRDQEDNSSIIYPGDLDAQFKDKVDLLLNAHAYAPHGNTVKEIDVGVKIGSWAKQLKVVGDRRWDTSMGIMFQTDPVPFEKLPIIYENAFGGIDNSKEELSLFLDNPIGRGYANSRSDRVGQKLPNVEYLDSPTKNKKPKNNKVAGFGPLCSHWAPRLNYGGTYDEKWQEERSPLFPLDFDPRFYQYAPEDQQIQAIYGGEIVTLLNLTSYAGLFEFKLPTVELEFFTKFKNDVITHKATLHTIIIEPDNPRLQMVWNTSIPCANKEQDIEHTYITCKTNEF
ncbi:MAG: DUF2169 domain-containing protein [Proteobacteria bacterium]|nr:DUF2169 domain-containing protein [Pseudomonadota bacterium]